MVHAAVSLKQLSKSQPTYVNWDVFDPWLPVAWWSGSATTSCHFSATSLLPLVPTASCGHIKTGWISDWLAEHLRRVCDYYWRLNRKKNDLLLHIYIYIHIYIYKYIYIPDAGPYIHISSITLYLYMYSIESLDQFPSPVSHFFRQKPRFGACAASTTHCTCCRGVSSARKAAFCATVAANSACCLGVLPLPWCGSGMMVSGMPCSCWAAVCILSIYIYI